MGRFRRNELIPELPALAEAMPGFEATIWYGLFAPANTPAIVINRGERTVPDDAGGQGTIG